MPIYEFHCERCGGRFERLVDRGTDSVECPECGAGRTERVLSPLAAPFHLVKAPGERRRQERRNAALRASAKARFKEARRRARGSGPGGGGS